MKENRMRCLPAVHSVANHPSLAELRSIKGRKAITNAVRMAVEEARRDLANRREVAVDEDALARRAAGLLAIASSPSLRRVINATGILLNTGLGRSPLATEAADAVDRIVRGYCNLEYDLETGQRGGRTDVVESLLIKLTGAEAATVVNNNAGATLLCLRALAAGREVIISRGQLIEIGGNFRLPEILELSGAHLREVGTTNKTRLSDYDRAISPATAALFRAHPSNYRVVGFTEAVSIIELAKLAHTKGILAIDDIGSGALSPGIPPHVHDEPTATEAISAGADVVLFSGDKLMGGPQCGIIIGKSEPILRMRSDPLIRALRVDKMTLAALEATLQLLLDPSLATSRLPLWSLLATPIDAIHSRASRLAFVFRENLGLNAVIEEASAYLGAGSTPLQPIPTVVIRVRPPFPPPWKTEAAWSRALRLGEPPVIARTQGGCLLFDLRALTKTEDQLLEDAVRMLLAQE